MPFVLKTKEQSVEIRIMQFSWNLFPVDSFFRVIMALTDADFLEGIAARVLEASLPQDCSVVAANSGLD